MLYSNFTTEAVQYSIESEAKAIALYVKEMEQEGITVKVDEVGLLQSKDKPFLAASLDGIVTNLTTQEKWGIEIKSPLSKVGMRVEDACKSETFFLEKLNDGTIRIKRNHDYYIQVQGQLYVATDLNIETIHVMCTLVRKCLFSKRKFLWKALPRHKFFFQKGSLS